MSKSYLDGLNKNQRRVVKHGLKCDAPDHRPLLVLAGAGTGKTETITHRVAHLILNGTPSHRILLLAFGRSAATEMTERAKLIVEKTNARQVDLPWSGTFHSIGSRLVRPYARRVGLRSNFTVMDPADARLLMSTVRSNLGFAKQASQFPDSRTYYEINSYCVNSRKSLPHVLNERYPQFRVRSKQLTELFSTYNQEKRRRNVADFDDLLSFWLTLMNDAKAAAEIRCMFDHVLVDQFQDTNRLQAQILMKLKPDGCGLTVVGDDWQAIYSFRAANIKSILRFPKQFSPKARIVKLEQNYRFTQPILDACNSVIALSQEGYEKKLWSNRRAKRKPELIEVADERAQANMVAQQIINARNQGIALKDQAVLFRDARLSIQLELELTRRKVPFRKFGSRKFLEVAHIKDFVGVLRWYENPRDRLAGARVLQLLPGIGSARATKMLDQLDGSLGKKAMLGMRMPRTAREAWAAFVVLVIAVRTSPWSRAFALVRKWCEPHLRRKYGSSMSRSTDLDQLAHLAKSYDSCERFLTELSIDPPDETNSSNPGTGKDIVVLSTIHSAKGREWPIVRLLSAVEGVMPSRLANSATQIEEERRLLYVAMSRAKDQLQIYVPRRLFMQYQADGPGQHYADLKRSRFLPPATFRYFERRDFCKKAS